MRTQIEDVCRDRLGQRVPYIRFLSEEAAARALSDMERHKPEDDDAVYQVAPADGVPGWVIQVCDPDGFVLGAV